MPIRTSPNRRWTITRTGDWTRQTSNDRTTEEQYVSEGVKWTILRVILREIDGLKKTPRRKEKRLAYLKFETDTICFRDIEKLDELAPDTVDFFNVIL
jgi:hypothetical protein